MKIPLMAALTALVLVQTACKPKQQELKAQQRNLTEAVYASGMLITDQDYKLLATTDGYLLKELVKEGDAVKSGQVLFQLSSSNRHTLEESARMIVQKTMPLTDADAPVLRELGNRIELARAKVTNDSLQCDRYQRLYAAKAISKSAFEKYALQLESSRREFNSLKQQYLNATYNAALQKQQANNQLNQAANEIHNAGIQSLTDGIVYEIYKHEGDLVMPNQAVALIGAGKVIARLAVDESDLYKIQMNQKVVITIDAFPDKIWHAKISKIYPVLDRVEQSVRVDVTFDEALPANIYGLNVEANIIIVENKSVLTLPKSAIAKGDTVWVKSDKGIEKVKITRGIEDKEFVEISSGITAATTIVLPK